jgi:hypothetical protein
MKKILLVLFALGTLFNFSCSNNHCCVLPDRDLFINAERNNSTWLASPVNSKLIGDTIAVMGNMHDAQRYDFMGFKFKYSTNGKYTLKGTNGFYYYAVGPSSFMNNYKVDTTAAESYVIVDSYDKTKQIISGSFSLHLVRWPDTIAVSLNHVTFLNGKFKVRLQN